MKSSEVVNSVKMRFPNEPEYLQAVKEVVESIEEVYNEHHEFEKAILIERLIIPVWVTGYNIIMQLVLTKVE